MRETGLSKMTLATAIAKRLESRTRMFHSDLYYAQKKFRSYREITLEKLSFKDHPIKLQKIKAFNKRSMISVIESLQEETLSARKLNQAEDHEEDLFDSELKEEKCFQIFLNGWN